MPKIFHSLIMAFAISAAMLGNVSAQTRDLAMEESNRKLVVDFYNQFFNQHDTVKAAESVAENYLPHNPLLPDGKKAFVDFFNGFFQGNPDAKAQIIRSGTDGDLVFLHVHFKVNTSDRGQALVDIFRVKDGKIIEHWDVMQVVPENAANTNTMF
ncbi:nuclear transport factor 2 family protein [Pectobacterium brasiliense]|uniref:nuclear transport factor 2 family protein n=1 Tax=Pectobacterium brasiliense TaxID=180957 RepID=UPI0006503A82|nr:ester cyclase [Pectobacterium brasiliense]KMK82245.1 hypothetical protein KCO_17362 [Pectobacterium brasiliense ICMP 19477]